MIAKFLRFFDKKLILCIFLGVVSLNNVYPQIKYNRTERETTYDNFLKGRNFLAKNELDSAIYYYKLNLNFHLSNKDTSNSIKEYNYIAALLWRNYEFDSAFAYLNSALTLMPQNKKGMNKDKADLYQTLGMFYFYLGDYANAAIYSKLTLDFRLTIKYDPSLIECYTFLGRIEFNLGNYDKAIEYYQKAISIKFFKKDWNNRMVATNYDYIGNAYLKKNNIAEARKYFLKGFGYLRLPQIYLDLGKIFILEKKYFDADTSLRKGLDLFISSYGEKYSYVSNCYSALGDLYKEQKDFEKSLEFYTKALNSSIKTNEEKFFTAQSQKFHDIISINAFCESLIGKTKILLELGRKDSTVTRLLYAKKILAFSIPILSTVQEFYSSDISKLKLREMADEIMNLGVEVTYELYKNYDKKYVLQTFLFSEAKRNSVLNESKIKRKAMLELNIPDSLKNAELKLKVRLDRLFISSEASTADTQGRKTLEQEKLIISTFNEYDSLIAKIKRDYPKYSSLVLSEEKLTIHKILQNSKNDVTIVYTTTNDNIFIFCITDGNVNLIKKVKNHSFDKLISEYRNSIKKVNQNAYLNSAKELYNILILPVEKEILSKNKLIIIPCPELASLPFEALVSSKNTRLFEKVCVQYLSSSNFIRNNKRDFTDNFPYYFMGVSPSYENHKEYSPLKNKEEINDISALMHKKNLRDTLFTGEKATKENFINSINKSKILHIAAHSFADTLRDGNSGIVFGESTLSSAEIIANEFKNDLVVLSSCEGGSGKTANGEGVLSLARNFIRAGAKNTIVALWKVADKQTRLFMLEFYKQLLKDNDYAEALTRTKRELKNNPLFSFPNTWAAFVLMK